MLQHNTQKEIYSIFLWLIGIILVYSLVHTWILEPSFSQDGSTGTKDIQDNQIKHTKKEMVSVATSHTDNGVKVEKEEKIKEEKPSIIVLEKKERIKKASVVQDEPKADVKKEVLEATKPLSVPMIPQVTKVPQHHSDSPTIPDIPALPSVPTYSSSKNRLKVQNNSDTKKIISDKKETSQINTSLDTLSKDIGIKRMETKRQQLRQEAEDIRKEALKILEL